jgi:hypothetical protein
MMNILRRITLWQKFAVLGLIALVMASIPLVQVVMYKSGELAVAQAEDAGLDPVRTLVALQKNLQAHRGLSAMVLSGNSTVDAERRARQADVNTQFTALDKQLTALGYSKAADPAKAMKSGWDQLSQKVDARSINAKDSFEAHTALVEQNIAVIEIVADASGLSLDPVAESYYVMTAVVDHLPRLAEAIEVLRTSGIDALTNKDTTPTTRANLVHLSHAVHVAQGRAGNQLAKASEIDTHVAQALGSGAKAAEVAADALHEAGEEIAATGATTVDATAFAKLGQTASDAQFLAMTAATEVLEKLLHVPHRGLNHPRVRVAADQLGSASRAGLADLAEPVAGASQQAASVEQTTASLQEMAPRSSKTPTAPTVTDGIATQAAQPGPRRRRRPWPRPWRR